MKVKKYLPLLLLVTLLLVIGGMIYFFNEEKEAVDFTANGVGKGKCNVGVITITGFLDTYPSDDGISSLDIAQTIRSVSLEDVSAITLLIDSNGGTPASAEEIARAVSDVDLPVVAFVRGAALSGAYWVAATTDHIVSLETASIGNIGVTSSYLSETENNAQEGYVFEEVVSGEFKEVGNSYKPLTPEGRQYLQEHTDHLFQIFADTVKTRRALTQEQLNAVSDAKFYLANRALELGLIDQVGGVNEVKEYLHKRLDVPTDQLLLCEPNSFVY